MHTSVLAGVVTAGLLTIGAVAPQTSVGDGSDPNNTGCSSSASTPVSVSNPAGIGGTLELRFSANCQTAWARFTCQQDPNGFGCSSYEIFVRRNSDGKTFSQTVSFPTSTPVNHQLFTAQLNDGTGQSAKACFVNTSSDVTACTASF